jgi:hypothetical protein
VGGREAQGRAARGRREPGLRQHHRSLAAVRRSERLPAHLAASRCGSRSFRPTTTSTSSGIQPELAADRVERPQDPDPAINWYGNAVGKWEGDTLVVDSVGYKDSTWLDARGLPHTQDLHLVERIHSLGENLAFDITFEDPGAFTKPWTRI